jgi:hypothetical protein
MEELLKRWAELEPKWCEFELPIGRFYVHYNLNNGHYGNIYNLDDPTLAHIQRAIQNAIEARGWDMTLERRNTMGGWAWFADTATSGITIMNTPAEALLSAYIKALEAVQK